MENDMKEILEYQKIDSQIRKLEAEIKNSEDRKNASRMQEYLQTSQAKLAKLEEQSEKLVKLQKKALETYNEFVAKLEAIMKEEVKSKADVSSQMEKLNSMHTYCTKLEKDMESLKSSLEKIAADFDALMKNSKTARGNFEVYKNRFNAQKQKLEPEIKKLEAERDKLAKACDGALLQKYKQKAESKSPVFVACVSGSCGGCRMEISGAKMKALKESKIIECENCGRLIYLA